MTEIKKTLAILKARWPEVSLLIGLDVLSLLSNFIFGIGKLDLTTSSSLLPFGVHMVFIIVLLILGLGFLRTFYLEGQKQQPPLVLLRTGKHFFWRMFGLGLLFMIIYLVLAGLIFLIVKQFTSMDTSFFQVTPWIRHLCFAASMLILIKPILLIPALIIVLDCKALKSFKLLKQCKILNMKELVVLFFVSMALTFLWAFLPTPQDTMTISQYILIVCLAVVGNFIGLMIVVLAVRFVASLDLVYDEQISPSDSQRFTEE